MIYSGFPDLADFFRPDEISVGHEEAVPVVMGAYEPASTDKKLENHTAAGVESALRRNSLLQITGNQCKLIQRGLKVFHDLGRDHVRIGQVRGVFQAVVLQPEDVQAGFVALD